MTNINKDNIYEELRKGNMIPMMEACKINRIHYAVENIIKMLIATHNDIFMDVLNFHLNYISEYIVSDTFEVLLLKEDCGEKIGIMIEFLKKHGFEYMIKRNSMILLETAIKYNRHNSITYLLPFVSSHSLITQSFYQVKTLDTFIHMEKQIGELICMNINIILYIMMSGQKINIIKYIIKKYILYIGEWDYDNIKYKLFINCDSTMTKYNYNIGIRMDLIHKSYNDAIILI
jgi:hypothetical protein